jgi:hypothetical protein
VAVLTIPQVRKRLKELSLDRDRFEHNAIRAAVRAGRKAAVGKLVSRGAGAAIWGHKARAKLESSGLSGKGLTGKMKTRKKDALLMVNTHRVHRKKDGYLTHLSTHGIARLIQTGGKTGPFTGRNQYASFPHPGTRFRRYPFLHRALRVIRQQFPAKMDRALKSKIKKLGL